MCIEQYRYVTQPHKHHYFYNCKGLPYKNMNIVWFKCKCGLQTGLFCDFNKTKEYELGKEYIPENEYLTVELLNTIKEIVKEVKEEQEDDEDE